MSKKINKKLLTIIISAIILLVAGLSYRVYAAGVVFTVDNSSQVIETFTAVGPQTWLVPEGVSSVELLVVAGGGGGGSSASSSGGGGGGGAGGLKYLSSFSVNEGQIINITVGSGGTPGATGLNQSGNNGTNSTFDTVTATGGGGGASTFAAGKVGGSGGGAGYNGYSTIKYGGSGVSGEGNAGGNTSMLSWAGGAGGGGAGGAGGDNKINHAGGDRGAGLSFSISGSPVTYAIGGAGGANSPVASPNNTGKGGDAAYAAGVAYAGGSGIVVIKYNSSPKIKSSSIQSGLVAHWPLDGESYNATTGRVTDKTPYEHHGTNSGTTLTTDRMGQSNGATNFDGVANYIGIGNGYNYFPLSKFSICSWIKSPGLAAGMTVNGIISFTYGLTLNLNSAGQFWSRMDDGVNLVSVSTTDNLHDNKFHHLCLTYDGTNRYMFIDGVLKITAATTWLSTTRWPTNTASIGHENNNPPVAKFNGTISDIRLYNRALSVDEINSLYNAYKPKTVSDSLQKGLVLDMPLTSNYTKTVTVGSEIMTDRTPYSNNAQNFGGVIGNDFSSFNGSSQYVGNFLDPAPLEPAAITVSSWINMDIDASTVRHIWFTKWYGYSFEIEANTRIPYFRLNGPGDIRSSQAITLGQWHHVVGTYDTSIGGRIYLDGELVGTKATSLAIAHTRNYPLNIGRYAGGIYFKGKISSAKIYNRALSAEEVKLLYDKGR